LATSYNYSHFSIKPYNKWYKEFLKHLPLGSLAPDFSCIDVDGKRVKLSQFRNNSFVVLEFGCMTCAPAVTQSSTYQTSLSKMMPEYSDKGVQFLMVYTRETHPGENIRKHTKFEEKLEHAKLFRELEKVQLTLLVDSLDGKIHRKYGYLPNMIYIINKERRIVYKASWTDAREIKSVLENLLLWEKEGFTPMDSVAVVEKYHFIYDRDVAEHKRIYERSGPTAVKELQKEVKLPI
jgi:peroxiredoxin